MWWFRKSTAAFTLVVETGIVPMDERGTKLVDDKNSTESQIRQLLAERKALDEELEALLCNENPDEGPTPPFRAGDLVMTAFLASWDRPRLAAVLDVEVCSNCRSGWRVTVLIGDGIQKLDSGWLKPTPSSNPA